MARQPEVFVRELGPEEAQRLVKVARTAKNPVRLRRAGMVLASMQGRSAPDIAVMFAAKQDTVRKVIQAFNERGLAALDPKVRRGSMPKIGPAVREQICQVAKSDPQRLGCPFTGWSLPKLRDYLAEYQHITVSHETVRQVLKAAGISWQATKTWKGSTDPNFIVKKDRILSVYDRPPPDGRVICVDEFGPLNLQPRPGRGWYPAGAPKSGCGRPTPVPLASGTCSRHWTWLLARCSTGSGTANVGGSSKISCVSSALFSPLAGCTWSAATTARITKPKSRTGARPTTWNWSSPPPTRPG